MDAIYITCVDDEHVGNHDYDDNSDDDGQDSSSDIDGHISAIYR